MMQCGMFVAANTYRADVRARIFTHFKREEEAAMNSGKFDEELSRMSGIVDQMQEHSLVLFNESFAATNEREGSEIARQIVTALIENGTKVFFVSHQSAFAGGFLEKNLSCHLFLRAERQSSGSRTFKVIEGAPLQTSHDEDLYQRIFGDAAAA
jgi:DNA mismatch repair ATPase MutS